MRNVVISSMALALVGCLTWQKNPSHEYKVWIDPTFSSEQTSVIMNGAYEWQMATDNFITFGQVSDRNDATISVVAQSLNEIRSEFGPHVDGECSYHGTPSIIDLPVDASFDGFWLSRLARHEVGHAIGDTQHLPDGNVMAADINNQSEHITCMDVSEMCRSWGVFECDSSAMMACQPHF